MIAGGSLAGMAGIAAGAGLALRVFGQNVAAFDCSVLFGLILGCVIGASLGLAAYVADSRTPPGESRTRARDSMPSH